MLLMVGLCAGRGGGDSEASKFELIASHYTYYCLISSICCCPFNNTYWTSGCVSAHPGISVSLSCTGVQFGDVAAPVPGPDVTLGEVLLICSLVSFSSSASRLLSLGS